MSSAMLMDLSRENAQNGWRVEGAEYVDVFGNHRRTSYQHFQHLQQFSHFQAFIVLCAKQLEW